MKHGITIREKKTNKLVEFIGCDVGRGALRVLSGVRHNLDDRNYEASEEFVEEKEIAGIKNEN